MANVNTSFGYSLGLPGAISITTAAATQIVVPAFSYNSGAPVPSPTFPAGSPLQVQFPPDVSSGSSTVDGHPFKVTVVGVTTGGTASTDFGLNLYLGNSATLTSNTNLVTTTPIATTATNAYNFIFSATLLWDSISKNLNGSYTFQVGDSAVASAAITQATGVSESGLIFTLATVYTALTGTSTLNLKEFTISAV